METAEILLPEDALQREVRDFCRAMDIADMKVLDFNQFATLIIFLTVKYQMPLKAIIYRLAEEHYIESIDKYIENYDFIKKVIREIRIIGKRVDELYSTENNYVIVNSSTYQDMERATGNAWRENILEDAAKLNLDMSLINDFLADDIEATDDDDDNELFSIINAKQG